MWTELSATFVLTGAVAAMVLLALISPLRLGAPAKTATTTTNPRKPAAASALFSPLKLGRLRLRNRVVRAAAFGGNNKAQILSTHQAVAEGGVAMSVLAYASISRQGCTFQHQLVVDEALSPFLRDFAHTLHAHGAAACVQLTHSGVFADESVTGVRPMGPSAVFNPAAFGFPAVMDAAARAQVLNEHVEAALLCKRNGIDCVELHAGHGYLISQWLSPHTNRRTDEFGGDAAGRLKFPLMILRAIRGAVGPDFPILVKMNVDDGFEEGISLTDAKQNAVAFAGAGASALVCSGGFVNRNGFFMLRGATPLIALAKAMPSWSKKLAVLLFGRWFVPTVPFEPNFFQSQATEIIKAVRTAGLDTPVALVGGVSSLQNIDDALDAGFAFVEIARALICEPDFVNKIKEHVKTSAAGNVVSKCTHCNECVVATISGAGVICPYTPAKNNW